MFLFTTYQEKGEENLNMYANSCEYICICNARDDNLMKFQSPRPFDLTFYTKHMAICLLQMGNPNVAFLLLFLSVANITLMIDIR